MKLIDEFESAHDADLASLNYREKGILTQVSSRHSNSLRMITGATKVGLWVVLDDQYQDAIELRKNRSHRPSTTLSEDEMNQLEVLGKSQLTESSAKMLYAIGYGVITVVLAGYILTVSFGLFNLS
jgi:hypothetical protein